MSKYRDRSHFSRLTSHVCLNNMTEREFYIYTIKDELPRFERALYAIPETNVDYRPDPKSKTALELAMVLVSEAATLKLILETGDIDFAATEKPAAGSPVELAKSFAEYFKESAVIAEKMSDDEWDVEARMHMAGANEWKAPKGKMVFSFVLDLIHHRGQLSTYFRAMGGKVPSIYGPSADSQE